MHRRRPPPPPPLRLLGSLQQRIMNMAPKRKSTGGVVDGAREEEKRPEGASEFKGRLGYACLNTYLRTSTPSIFSSRTCRLDTVLKQGPFSTHGLPFLHSLCLQNLRDTARIIRWNERYNIRLFRLSSELFPFASHPEYGYDLSFAAAELRGIGEMVMAWGHRVSTHPGHFTQLGSLRPQVVETARKELGHHAEILRSLGLRGQADRDAVIVMHMGGVYNDKKETVERFEQGYRSLDEEIKERMVLENDDVNWTVSDLLPICKSLNIPLVLDHHHHNLVHDPGTRDITPFLPAIAETWTRKGITQKQHYSESCAGAVTAWDKRKHSPRIKTLPVCGADSMDLMIEAKDKEQAVFEMMRKYQLGLEVEEVLPHVRADVGEEVSEEERGMGGPERRVYWPEGKEEWLLPKKRETRKKAKGEEIVAVETETEKGVEKEIGQGKGKAKQKKPRKKAKGEKVVAVKTETPRWWWKMIRDKKMGGM